MPRPTTFFTQTVLTRLFLVAGCPLSLAQTISDSNQNQTWGVWKTPNPQTPGIQFRAKCDSDNDAIGRMVSEWSYQFRNTYKGTMDIVYLTEGGIAQPPVNKMVGPFLDTLKPGEIFSNGAQLYGSCGQHSAPKAGLHMTLKCAVPTGQDAPCFKDSDGKRYPQAAQSGSQAGPRVAGTNSGGDLQAIKAPTSYWTCMGMRRSEIGTDKPKEVVLGNIFRGPVNDDDNALQQKFEEEFKAWLDGNGSRLNLHIGDSSERELVCYNFPNREGAVSERVILPKDKAVEVDWPPVKH